MDDILDGVNGYSTGWRYYVHPELSGRERLAAHAHELSHTVMFWCGLPLSPVLMVGSLLAAYLGYPVLGTLMLAAFVVALVVIVGGRDDIDELVAFSVTYLVYPQGVKETFSEGNDVPEYELTYRLGTKLGLWE